MSCAARFRANFDLIDRIGESNREKTGTEGEVLRGHSTDFASFLCIQDSKVSVFGSGVWFWLDSRDRPR